MLTAGMPWPSILFVILVDWVMIVTGLVGALVRTSYKWGFYVFGCVALFYILYQLVWEARRHANAMGNDVGKTFLQCGTLTAVLWTLYPIAWGVSEGANVIAPDSEAAFYGVLDVLAKPVFGALLIWGHRNIDPGRLGLHIHDYTEKDVQFEDKKKHVTDEEAAADRTAAGGLPGDTNGTNGINGTNGHAA